MASEPRTEREGARTEAGETWLYRSEEKVEASNLPGRYKSSRCFSTSIYFLLEGKQFSSFHKLQSDELWHFYDGSPIKVYIINSDGILTERTLGKNFKKRENHQIVIPKLSWFAAEVVDKSSFSLIGCTVAPGFEFDDFELGNRVELIEMFPSHSELIKQFTR